MAQIKRLTIRVPREAISDGGRHQYLVMEKVASSFGKRVEDLTSDDMVPLVISTKLFRRDDNDSWFTIEVTHPDNYHLADLAHATSAEASPEQRTAEPYLFRVIALILPRRLWEEELGDALEVLYALRESGAPRWQIRLKIFSTFAWGLVNALREVMSAVTGQAREREK
jgi:hypothetical protein